MKINNGYGLNQKTSTWAERFCIGAVCLFLILILGFLTWLSVRVTCTVYGGDEIVDFRPDGIILHLIFFCTVMALCVIRIKSKVRLPAFLEDNKKFHRVLRIAGGLGILWILLMQFRPISDQRLAYESAQALLRKDWSPWVPEAFIYGKSVTGYAYTYPSQNGLILYFALAAALFGELGPYVLQMLNVLLLIGGMLYLAGFYKAVSVAESREGMTLLLLAFLPFTFYITFVYGTIPGFFCASAAMYYVYCFLQTGKWRDFFIGAAGVCGAVLLKSNYLIVLTALLIYLVTGALFQKRLKLLAAAVLLVLIYAGSKGAVNLYLERTMGASVSEGIPMLAWVEMGLSESEKGPGWYNGYHVGVFSKNEANSEGTLAAVQEDLKDTLTFYKENPGEAVDFLVRKSETLWAEPAFQGLWIQEVKGGSPLIPGITGSLLEEGGILNRIFVVFFNYIQTLIYAGALLFLLLNMRRITWVQLMPGVIFIGGFLFHLVWEAKGQYSVCYFVLLIPYAAAGLRTGAERIYGKIWGRIHN